MSRPEKTQASSGRRVGGQRPRSGEVTEGGVAQDELAGVDGGVMVGHRGDHDMQALPVGSAAVRRQRGPSAMSLSSHAGRVA